MRAPLAYDHAELTMCHALTLSLAVFLLSCHLARASPESVYDDGLLDTDIPEACSWDAVQYALDCTDAGLYRVPVCKEPVKRLYLARNRISSINQFDIKAYIDLQYLDLSGNNLTIISEHLFSKNKLLRQLKLGNNPLHCNCTNEWLRKEAVILNTADREKGSPHHTRIRDLENLTCTSPESYSHRPLTSLASALGCGNFCTFFIRKIDFTSLTLFIAQPIFTNIQVRSACLHLKPSVEGLWAASRVNDGLWKVVPQSQGTGQELYLYVSVLACGMAENSVCCVRGRARDGFLRSAKGNTESLFRPLFRSINVEVRLRSWSGCQPNTESWRVIVLLCSKE
ncbi:uncharacterized protein LOC5514915 isoform X1 [Nematostella vectensis]|uniref:uncharacterized protein LOC5514915 isoform X1 n=1 Tax=Nematostella vectensis TaxID=45351 RepID=UPI002077228E|nr:uncharacterized protein LOC5514915 isoform X1 [Nematostella vectensis]